jgi:transcription antitermination protein NusB
MLSRRHLRVKVLQALYAYFQSGNTNIDQGEKQLLLSINKLHELFVYQLSFLIETTRFAEQRIAENRKKHFPTPEDLEPNMHFVENIVLAKISENPDFKKKERLFKINWGQEQELVRRFYNLLRESKEYERLMVSDVSTFESDKKFMMRTVERCFTDFELLQSFYEEKSIFFVDDYHLVTYLIVRFLKYMEPDFDTQGSIPPIFRTEHDEINEDLHFVKKLFRETVMNSSEYERVIASSTSNWEKERIAVMDMLILKMALAELIYFPSIPIKVTLNEYIDISKFFSSAKSKVFVNGILDKLIHEFKASGRIVKTGRGLVE